VDIEKAFEKIPYERLYPVPAWQRYAVIFGLAISVILAFYFVVITGKAERIETLEQELSKIQKDVQDNRAHASKMAKLKEKVDKLEADRREASKQLPSEKEIPELLEQVSNLGTQTGLEFLTFKPQAEVLKEFYAEVPVSVEVTGRFHDVLAFFDEISHLPRIVTIGDMKIQSIVDSGGSKSGSAGPRGRGPQEGGGKGQQESGGKPKSPSGVQLTCVVTTYRFVEGAVKAGEDKDKDKDKVAKKEADAK
jgi:type IV pilus assembly protein PilO